MFRALFATFFFAVCVIAVGMMVLGMCADPAVPTTALTVDEQRIRNSLVEFSLEGSSTGEAALYLDDTLIAWLQAGESVQVSLVGNDRCGVSLKARVAGGEWTHAHSFGCLDHAEYPACHVTLDGVSAEVGLGAWQ